LDATIFHFGEATAHRLDVMFSAALPLRNTT
jgi:hypothetical protein